MSEDIEENIALTIDTKGLPCPIPSMRFTLRIRRIPIGGYMKVFTDTPHAFNSIPRFCRNFGHEITSVTEQDDGTVIYIIKRKGLKL